MLCCAPFFLIPRTCAATAAAADCEMGAGGAQSTTFFLSLPLVLISLWRERKCKHNASSGCCVNNMPREQIPIRGVINDPVFDA